MWTQLILVVGVVASCAANDSLDVRNKFVLYYSTGTEVYNVSDGRNILRSKHFDSNLKTVLYIHGHNENQDSESVKTVVAAYKRRDEHNIIILDWKDDAARVYVASIVSLSELAVVVANELLNMFDAGLDIQDLHLVGHSLGGQMAGRIGNEIKTKTRGSRLLKRISALDPAFPGFYGLLFKRHISKDDAEFVDIIHTDAGFYGGPLSTGHADFWPNGGVKVQPGCPVGLDKLVNSNDLCSHWRSWYFWAESVSKMYKVKFNAVTARNWIAFKRGNVGEFQKAVVMGIDCPTNIRGDYYLQTNTAKPFARGVNGVAYSSELDSSSDIENEVVANGI